MSHVRLQKNRKAQDAQPIVDNEGLEFRLKRGSSLSCLQCKKELSKVDNFVRSGRRNWSRSGTRVEQLESHESGAIGIV